MGWADGPCQGMWGFLAWSELGPHDTFQRELDEATLNYPLLLPLRNRNSSNKGRDQSVRSGKKNTRGEIAVDCVIVQPQWETRTKSSIAPAHTVEKLKKFLHISLQITIRLPQTPQPVLSLCHLVWFSLLSRIKGSAERGDAGDCSKTDF